MLSDVLMFGVLGLQAPKEPKEVYMCRYLNFLKVESKHGRDWKKPWSRIGKYRIGFWKLEIDIKKYCIKIELLILVKPVQNWQYWKFTIRYFLIQNTNSAILNISYICGWGQESTLEWSTLKVFHLGRLWPYLQTLD
jgi:hypothetical protein